MARQPPNRPSSPVLPASWRWCNPARVCRPDHCLPVPPCEDNPTCTLRPRRRATSTVRLRRQEKVLENVQGTSPCWRRRISGGMPRIAAAGRHRCKANWMRPHRPNRPGRRQNTEGWILCCRATGSDQLDLRIPDRLEAVRVKGAWRCQSRLSMTVMPIGRLVEAESRRAQGRCPELLVR